MSRNNQQNQSHAIGEMFDAANISQPVPFQGVPGAITPANIELPAPQPLTSKENNGFTADNIQLPQPSIDQEMESQDG